MMGYVDERIGRMKEVERERELKWILFFSLHFFVFFFVFFVFGK